MEAQELLDEWEAGEENGMRAERIQAVRDDLMAVTDEYIPRRIPEIESLILGSPQQRGVITRRLRDAVHGDTEDGDSGADSDSAE